ncbi:MAG TPA: NUDIX hydrolase [Peptococcaceae bacterium]|nr:MAG: NUDIX hydrolase [Clostridia bacterium 41_269]HBT20896.1 NUDIX hydrolase [Peptococcaceae bacterium]
MREYPKDPIVGVGGIILKDQAILLVKRGQPPSKGMWGIPGGCLELGESLKEGVAREVMEECGIRVEVGEIFDVFETVVRDDKGSIQFHYVLIDFFAYPIGNEELHPGSDVMDCRYIPLNELQKYDLTPGVKKLLTDPKRFEKIRKAANRASRI